MTACGGNLVGTWTVKSSCLNVSGDVDPSSLGLDPRSCDMAKISGSLTVTGTFTATAKAYTDGTTTQGNAHLDLSAGCLQISGSSTNCGSIGGMIQGATCESASGGGCSCTVAVNQKGGIGVISAGPGKMDGYTTAGNEISLTTDVGDQSYSYCVSGTSLTLSPLMAAKPVTGTIVLEQAGGTGTGGGGGGQASGTGGSTTASGGRGGSASTGSGGSAGKAGGTGGSMAGGGSTGSGQGPCDIYAAANTPCAAAYSMVRVLSSKYTGPLYQVRKGGTMTTDGTSSNMKSGVRGGGTTQNINAVSGYADSASQDTFCGTDTCTVSKLYDQSGNGNDLVVAPAGGYNDGSANLPDFEPTATKGAVTAGGHKVYSLYMGSREGYRLTVKGKNVPAGAVPEGIYEVADGTHYGTACCWDFGNAIPDGTKYGTMDTLFFGTAGWGNGMGSGPWFMADFEAGVWAGGSKVGDPGWGALSDAHPKNNNNPSMMVPFAMGILKTQPSKYALRSADVQKGADFINMNSFEGALPKALSLEGGIILGIGGDNSNHSFGTFFEGAIVSGYPTPDTDLAVLKNVQAVGYTK